jgi:lactoylglutathione lyase
MFKRIDHVALEVADIDLSIKFYESHFGCKHYYEHKSGAGFRIAYQKIGNTVLELVHRNAGGMKGFHFCFESDDFDGDVARLEGAGNPFMTPPHDTDAREPREKGWRRVVFKGPDGEAIDAGGRTRR